MSRSLGAARALLAGVALAPLAAQAQSVLLPQITVEQPNSGQNATPSDGQPVTQTTAGAVQGYRALTATSSTKTTTPLQQIPQSIQVIPRSLIDDQVSLGVSDAVRNVSGTMAPNALQTPAYESTYIRGFPAEQWLDGMTSYYNPGARDSLVNVERIEVLKGPSAILYGGGTGAPLGGVVNVISKMPTAKAFSEFGITIGSYKYYAPYFDVNQPLSKDGTVLFRVTGEYKSAGSSIDVLDTKTQALHPTFLYTTKMGTTFTLQGRFSDWQQQEYQGLPATGTVTGSSFALNPNLYVGPANIPASFSKVNSVTAKFDHVIDQIWSTSLQARYSKTEFKEMSQNFTDFALSAGNAPQFAPSTWRLLNMELNQQQEEFSFSGNALATFSLGGIKNKFLIGADYSHLTDNGGMYGKLTDLITLGGVNLQNPSFPPYVEPAQIPANTISDGTNTYVTQGAFAQIQTDIWDRIHLLGGVRLASLRIDSVSPTYGNALTDTTKALPRVGAVVDIVKGFSVFASYSEGMKGNPFVVYAGPPAPEMSKQSEAGIKFNLGYGISGSAAVFEINRSGVPVITTGILPEPVGEQRSRGFEADVLWQPDRHWQILANYTHIDAKLTNNAGAIPAGNQLNLVAPDSGRIWVNYKFGPGMLEGFSLGAGVYMAGGAFVDLANQYHTGGYYTVDAKVAYDTPRYSASITVKNLTNESYYVPYNYYGGRVAPGDARAVYGKFAVRFF